MTEAGAKTVGILVLQRAKGQAETRELAAPRVHLGRRRDNEIRLESGSVSERHARLEHRDGFWVLTDLGSRNGTYLNGRKIEGPTPIRKDDMIYIGDFILRLEPPPPARHGTMPIPGSPLARAALLLSDGARQQQISLGESSAITVGTDPSHDVVVTDPMASSTHCLVRASAEGLVVEDLSANGTFVHGSRVHTPRVLVKGDVITFGHPGISPRCVRLVVITTDARSDTGARNSSRDDRPSRLRSDTERPDEPLVLGPGLARHAEIVQRFLEEAMSGIFAAGDASEPRWKSLKQPLGRCLNEIGLERGYDPAALDQWHTSDEGKNLRVELTELVKRKVGFDPTPRSLRRRSRPPRTGG
jgi:pSer/pThr/pTyr-binding forkhead associated (FHA) protein